MRMQLSQLPAALLLVFGPTLALAQNPPKLPGSTTLEAPSIQQNTLSLEVVKSVPTMTGWTTYERAGITPTSYRLAGTPDLSGATWQTFHEGTTTTRVVNGRTIVSGSLLKSGPAGAVCGDHRVWVKSYLQFRVTPLGGTAISSNIKGDSACVQVMQ